MPYERDPKRDMGQLRAVMDADDAFMEGHQIRVDRGHGTFERNIPDWPLSDAEVRKILIRSFPNWTTKRGRARMATWTEIIVLHYREQYSIGRIAKDKGVPADSIRNILRRIRNAAKGLTTDGKSRKRKEAKPESVQRRDRRWRQRKTLTAAEEMRELFLRPLRTGGRLVWPDKSINSNRSRRIPDWARDENKVAALIEQSFPRYRTDRHQQKKASLWYHIILLYYGTGETKRRFFDVDQVIADRQWSRKNIASALEITDAQLRSALERITRCAVGLNSAGGRRKLSQSH
jgi:hypothetical protein